MSCTFQYLGEIPAPWRIARGWFEGFMQVFNEQAPGWEDVVGVPCGTNPLTFSDYWDGCPEPPDGAIIIEMCQPVPHFYYYNGVSWLNIARHNYTAVVAPTINDDLNDGYVVGSRWINTATDDEYVMTDSTVGAAVWRQTTLNGAGTGTVTSVALSMPAEFTVVGSPITTFGTFAVTKAVQTANFVYAGPSGGAPASPTFRLLTGNDIPFLDAAKINSGTLVHERGGLETDLSLYNGYIRISGGVTSQVRSIFSAVTNPLVTDDASAGYVIGSRWINVTTDEEWVALDVTNGAAVWKITTSSPVGGTVTSVALSLPSIFSVSGSPVTTSGTLTGTLANQTANTVFAGPSVGIPATPTFRVLVANDIPWATPNYLGATTPAGADVTFLRIVNAGIAVAEFDSTGRLQANLGLGVGNLFIGRESGSLTNTGFTRNVGVGDRTLRGIGLPVDTNSLDNTAIGYRAIEDITTGLSNTAVGSSAAGNLRSGTSNIAIGHEALLTLTSTNENVAIGYQALRTANSSNNVAVGSQALINATGSSNIAIGQLAFGGISAITGTSNIGIGVEIGPSLTSGTQNILLGRDTGFQLTTGGNNTLIGHAVDFGSATQRNYATAIGSGAVVDQSNALTLGGTNATTFVDVGSGTAAPEAKLHLVRHNATTNVQNTLAIFDAESTSTPAAGYGTNIAFRGNSNSTAFQPLGQVGFEWSTATHASRTAKFTVDAVRNGSLITEFLESGPSIVIGGTATSIFRLNASSSDTQSYIMMSGAAATTRGYKWQTAQLDRWVMYASSTAESGSNVGSDLLIGRYDDAGAFIANTITITRSTGAVVLANDFRVNGNVGFYNTAPVARPTYGTPTGTLTRTTFATGTVTLVQLAERVAAIISDLEAVGLFA